ncbi:MAG: CRISPR-associated protein Cas4 [Burkholderiales bacterium]|nr:CRISPR-associated protein Cas4 [Burkholderiales bacterium]
MSDIAEPAAAAPIETPELIALSALQHWLYCPRQCALIHQEQAFAENVHTLRGQAVHKTVDTPGLEARSGYRVERALPVWNDALGLIGKADVVEFHPDGRAFPVEYKHGSRHKASSIAACDDVQLAAQAMCLEAMTGEPVAEGAIFYAKSRKRRHVPITPALRQKVEATTFEVRQMLTGAMMPPPLIADSRCRECSLIDICQPFAQNTLSQHANLRVALFDPSL